MQNDKPWYLSKTIWGAAVAVAAPIANALGIAVDAGMQAEIADAMLQTVGGIGGLVAIWGRLTARRAIA